MPVKCKWWLRGTATVIGILGIPMIWMGAELVLLGGTAYYLSAGTLIFLSAVELWCHRRSGFYLFTAALLLTLAWTVYEAGGF